MTYPSRVELEKFWSDINKFWSYVDIQGPKDCWIWKKKAHSRGGYGAIRFYGKTRRANRVAYELTYGKLEEGKDALHTCDNPPCCNPAHLYAGTDLDNVRDMDARNRRVIVALTGEKCGASILTTADVQMVKSSKESGRSLARKLNVNKSTIYRIRNGRTWRNLP